MKLPTFVSFCALAALVLACNLPSPAGPTPSALPSQVTQAPVENTVPPPVASPTITPTPPPTETPTVTPTPTPSDPVLSPAKDPVNCRFGPGTAWQTIGGLQPGETASILAKTADGEWWHIRLPSNATATCWVAASVTAASGNLEAVGILAPPQAFVTKVSLTVKPVEVTVPGCVFPYTPIDLYGEITVNGPAIVKWHWETSQGDVSATDTFKFDQFGTRKIADYVKYGDKGNYWVKLVVTEPNSVVAEASYKVRCNP